MEILKAPIQDDKNYIIYSNGKVWSNKTNQFLKINKNHWGYSIVDLSINGQTKRKFIHRLVAETFIPNPNNYETVNHIDENKSNNDISNLEWCSQKYNNNYGTRIQRADETIGIRDNHHSAKKIAMCDKKTHEIIKIFGSISSACDEICNKTTASEIGNISQCAKGNRKSAYGYYWQFILK